MGISSIYRLGSCRQEVRETLKLLLLQHCNTPKGCLMAPSKVVTQRLVMEPQPFRQHLSLSSDNQEILTLIYDACSFCGLSIPSACEIYVYAFLLICSCFSPSFLQQTQTIDNQYSKQNMLAQRNLLYETKKSLLNNEDKDIPESELTYKEERDNLRTLLRRKQADIIRLQAQNDSLQLKIQHLEAESKVSKLESTNYMSIINPSIQNVVSDSQRESTALREQLQFLRNNNSELNAIKNQSERDCRQLIAENEKMRRRIRQLQIIEQMRRQRFDEEVKALQPIIVNDNETNELLMNGNNLLIENLRSGIVKTISDVFVNSASLSEKRKVNSIIIFSTSVNELRKYSQRNGLILLGKIYSNLRDLVRLVDDSYGQLQTPETRDQLNDWLQRSIVGVKSNKQMKKKGEECLYLFRLLALFYRMKFPLKGSKQRVDRDIEVVLQDLIVDALSQLICKE